MYVFLLYHFLCIPNTTPNIIANESNSFCPIPLILPHKAKKKHIASIDIQHHENYMPIYYTIFKKSTICISFISDTLTTPNKVCGYPFTNRLRIIAAPNTNTTHPTWNGKLYGSIYGAAIGSC